MSIVLWNLRPVIFGVELRLWLSLWPPKAPCRQSRSTARLQSPNGSVAMKWAQSSISVSAKWICHPLGRDALHIDSSVHHVSESHAKLDRGAPKQSKSKEEFVQSLGRPPDPAKTCAVRPAFVAQVARKLGAADPSFCSKGS